MLTVALFGTGGTIANTEDGRIGLDRLLADIRATHPLADPARLAELRVTELMREGAETFTPSDWRRIAEAVQGSANDPDVDGMVVTHGTYTAEETAYFLHLTVHTTKPVVVVCSQRRHGSIGNDGDRNLVDAVRVATSPSSLGQGVLVVLNEEIHSAREVMKTNQRPSGFTSGLVGVLGTVEADQVSFHRTPTRRHTASSHFALPSEGALPRVDIVATYAGADGAAIEGVLSAGAKGLVVNGFSYAGKPHHLQLPALRAAVERGVAVVLVNRGHQGRVPVEVGDGFVRGDNLTAQKARVLLALGLTQTNDIGALQRIFDTY